VKHLNHFSALALIACIVTGTLSLEAQSKIGYVDSQKILSSLKETQSIQGKLQEEQEKMYKHLQYLQDSLSNSQDDYVKNIKDNALIKDGTKKAIEKGIEELAYSIQTSQQKYQEELQKKYQELMQPLLDKVKKAVDNIRKAENMDFVFDSASQIILASDTKYDLTQKVLDEIITIKEVKDTGKKETKSKTDKD